MIADNSSSEMSLTGKTDVTSASSAVSDPADGSRDARAAHDAPEVVSGESGKSPASSPQAIVKPDSAEKAPASSRPAPAPKSASVASSAPVSPPEPSLPVSMKERPHSATIANGSPRLAGEVTGAEAAEDDFERRLAQLGFATPARSSLSARIFASLHSLLPFGRRRAGAALQQRIVAFDGFRSAHFEDKRERDRRYGTVYTVWEQESAFLVRLELPRRMPKSSLKATWQIPDEMPDYVCTLSLADNVLFIRASLPNEARRRLAYVSSSFPSDFETRIDFETPVLSYSYRLQNKLLEVIVDKISASRRAGSDRQELKD